MYLNLPLISLVVYFVLNYEDVWGYRQLVRTPIVQIRFLPLAENNWLPILKKNHLEKKIGQSKV
jgi:hypothetical protein